MPSVGGYVGPGARTVANTTSRADAKPRTPLWTVTILDSSGDDLAGRISLRGHRGRSWGSLTLSY